ncbi:MAG: type II toxin-antitoxin system VapC family toxin [Desulfuromonadaceae bacterium]
MMEGVLIDTNVILDLMTDDPNWADWSEQMLCYCDQQGPLYINPIIYAELSIGFERIEILDQALNDCGFVWLEIPRDALFLAGKVFLQYRKRRGNKQSPLPDFFIGAHAAVTGLQLLTRDSARYRSYFPTVELITPQSN